MKTYDRPNDEFTANHKFRKRRTIPCLWCAYASWQDPLSRYGSEAPYYEEGKDGILRNGGGTQVVLQQVLREKGDGG